MNEETGISVLHITDLHVFAEQGRELLGVVTDTSLEAVLDLALAEATPDALLVTGDVAEDGKAEAYRRAGEIVARRFSGPNLWLPGNHDVDATMRASGAEMDRLALGDWLIVAIDTHIDGQVSGHIEAAEIERLEGLLARSEASHVLICGHHPPVVVGTPWLDTQIIDNAAQLLALLERHERVRGYLFGHVHQAFEGASGRIRIIGTPSTCYQFEPGSEQFSIDVRSPGYRWLNLRSEGSIETTVCRAEQIRVPPYTRKAW
jgi:Icc protein